MNTEEVLKKVQTVKEAQELIAALTEKFASQTAVNVLAYEARCQKRSRQKIVYHTAGNFLRSARTRRFPPYHG